MTQNVHVVQNVPVTQKTAIGEVTQVFVKTEMERSYIDYSMSVIAGRALPDVRDGLKPVHRRILYAMDGLGMEWNKPYKKSARMVGEVIGKYHPHGDTSVYDAAVRMAQPFSMNALLADGQGNFGSIDGDNPAAMRYTEIRMSRLSSEFFDDIKHETVEFRPNYDGHEVEPVVLPVPYPNLLVNGSDGIAVGMAVSIPPHNLRDIVTATALLVANPDATTAELMAIIKAPDFPTKGIVFGVEGMVSVIETGRGRVKLRAKWHEEPRGRGASSIIIDEFPYQVNKVSVINKIVELVKKEILTDVIGIRDESDKDGIRLVIEIRAGAIADVVFAQLAVKTELETSISYNCTVVEDNKPRLYGLKTLIMKWIEFRMKVLLNRFIFFRKEANTKLHILDGFMIAFNALDNVIALIRRSGSGSDAKTGLITLLSVDEIQAQAILDLRLQKLTGFEIDSLKADRIALLEKISDFTSKIENPDELSKVLLIELATIDARYGHERLTEISNMMVDMTQEDMIPREDVLIIVTKKGYVKRLAATALNEQNRNTRGKRVLEVGEDDEIQAMYHVNSHDLLMVFTESGQSLGVKAYSIPESSLTGRGRHIKNVIEGLDEEISAIIAVPENDKDSCLTIITRTGQVKRSAINDYLGVVRRGGIRGLNLDEGDAVVGVYVTKPHDHLMLVANTGKAIRFDIEDIRITGRATGGVRGILLDSNEHVIGTHWIQGNGQVADEASTKAMDDGQYLLCIGEHGVGKRSDMSEFGVQNRAGRGVYAFNINKKTGEIIKAFGVNDEQDLILTASNGVSNRIAVKAIRVTGRVTSGVFLINLDKNEKLVGATTAASIPLVEQEDAVV